MKEELKKNKLILLAIIFFLSTITILVYKPKLINAEGKMDSNFLYEKIIIIGDSRMELIENKKDYTKKLPTNMEIIAKSSKEIKWFNNHGIYELSKLISKNSQNTAVVINMGVNDLQFYEKHNSINSQYIQSLKTLTKMFPDVKFYFLSVNPVNENIINEYFKNNKRNNDDIEIFNKKIETFIKSEKNNNLNYCDSYNNIHFNTKDGLHYTKNTNEKIIDYIINDCLIK